ncbi:MAG TPA: alpha-ketoglutarate-dependent dioxygenase AlkB [Acidimicrobiales bacterium]|jgi:alkylated DNA repair protein (DNA oxidative demethylase)|nr:alpha-ketoglutarate-dependent dioxygenase AlkB [Acidimicrobiales bacterium]
MSRLIPRERVEVAPGAIHLPGWLDPDAQRRLASSCRAWIDRAGGAHAPRLPTGGVMSVEMACLGWHWFPYGYSRTVDDGDGREVAAFPDELADLGRRAVADAYQDPEAGDGYQPDVALLNWYQPKARMGMHADRDERSPAPVVSLSLGDTCVFRFGNPSTRNRPWTDVELESGDLFVFGGESRLAYHGVPKLLPGTGDPDIGFSGGRYNLTIRQTGLTVAG